MADDVPVTDILCEAMEYLSKLGANLRTRSETLKEKQIRKDKLKNSHAVLKAAQKVLTICELSKKSLNNVELGVKKVLAGVDAAQASTGDDGGKTKDRDRPDSRRSRDSSVENRNKAKDSSFRRGSSTDKTSSDIRRKEKDIKSRRNSSESRKKEKYLTSPKTISISGKKYTLRFPRKISMKHYQSVQVLARAIPSSMLNKYPVYYNCKLYRERKALKEANRNTDDNKNKCEITEKHKTVESDSENSDIVECQTVEKSPSGSDTMENKDNTENKHISDGSSGPCFKTQSQESEDYAVKKAKHHSESKEVNDDIEEVQHSKKKLSDENEIKKGREQDQSCGSSDADSRANSKTKSKDDISEKNKKKHSKSKINKDENEEDEHPRKKRENKKKKVRVIIDSSSETDEVTIKKTNEKSSEDKSENKSLQAKKPIVEPNLGDKCPHEKSDESTKIKSEDKSDYERPKEKSKRQSQENSDDDCTFVKEITEESSRHESKKESFKESSCELPSEMKSGDELIEKSSDEKENEKGDMECNSEHVCKTPEPVKPLIKCVSLTKLLKPDVLSKGIQPVNATAKEKESKNVIVHMNRKGELKTKLMADPAKNKVHEKKHSDVRNLKKLSEKRKQLAAFKPKNFYIKVMKLPKLNIDFLNENNLKRITQFGSVICEISPNTSSSNTNSDEQVSKGGSSREGSTEKSADKAKNALLNDSDAEKSEASTKSNEKSATIESSAGKSTDKAKNALNDSEAEKSEDSIKSNGKSKKEQDSTEKSTNKAKHALLNDLETENEKPGAKENVSEIDCNETEKIKNSLLNDSESDKDDDTPVPVSKRSENDPSNSLETNNNSELSPTDSTKHDEKEKSPEKSVQNDDQDKELAKSSLLNYSSGSSPNSPEKKRKNDDSGNKSRRKHIMESMHAKKMLLTYSSSSDTEDEQLKNVIKDIKDNLIKEIDNEDETKKAVKKKLLSSDSDEDVVKHINKKRKTSKSKSPSPKIQTAPSDGRNEEAEKEGNKTSSSDHDETANKKNKSSHRKMGRSKEKAGESSSHNSESLDDKDIEGLTNLKTLNKQQRRRRDCDSDKSDSTNTKDSASVKKGKMSKLKHISGDEGLLEAPESSDEASAVESEGPDEDLPSITLSGLNGDGLQHLAKDDLLDESESDSSKDKGSEDKKDTEKDTDSDSDAVKSKRRKGNTISSESEAGSSRRKAKGEKMSDFEDSEDENSEPIKRSKRKKTGSDSDASADSSNDGGKKKRRRIKQIDSDASGSDSENDGKNKHGRKNIRKVMGKNQLEEATKKAAREEKERVARIMERQKMYNNLEFDESGKPDEVIVDKVVLDFDPNTKEPLIEVDRELVKKLKPHQANGIKFMWDACFESVKRIKKDRGSGCILAHCMGLGKTLQVVSLTHTLLIHSALTGVHRVLVVCPLSTVLNWVNEFNMWLKHAASDFAVDVYELSKFKQNSERAMQLSSWFKHGGVCVLGYEMFRNLSADNPKKFKKKMLKQFQESLVDPGPDLVVCDEGHLLKNEKTSLSQSMNRVRTLRRIVLTGTPLQNNLKEYYCMVQFVKPNLLGKYNEYLNRFVNPITNGQYTDSTEYDIKVMKRRSHVLHKMLDGAVQRRDYGVLAPFLPPKHEYVLFITLTEVQVKLYQHYLDNYSRRPLPGKSSGFLFPDFQSLQRIWTHPLVLKYNSERYEIMQQKKREREEEEDSEGSLVDFIDDDSTPDESSSEDESGSDSDVSDDSRKKSKKNASKKNKKDGKGGQRRGTRANPVELGSDIEPDPVALEVKNENPTEWWIPLVTDDEIEDMRNSHKLVLLFEILRQCEAIGDKLLVFSQSLYSLDLIEHFLGKVDEATQEGRIDEKLGGHVGSWSPGIDYFRLDGSTSCENRSIWCKNFNREDNPRARLFLISTRAGGLGINLVAANRVVIFDVSWNPSHDVQSIFRVYRFGQKKPCYIYRFLAMGTMEEKIYERQVTKQAISKRVIDEQQIDRHYAENDLAELYKFEPRPPEPRPVPLVPKDRLFAEMLKEREAAIYKFHEHDSLLENKEEETLSEEERKAAWDDFENEKNRPPPQPFTGWPMHNGMGQLPNLLAQQQQQLAYAALATMLRKDMPNLTDDNIRAMLPLIYNSNPQMFGGYDYGLMQKLSSMYAQPGMMNPAMMNPGMNVGGAVSGMGGGGSSGLQYEPPWQRQQQQQQQMRLQQLMQQQQNQMGAKFYAGGLGSRDPIAMALQQQRAREIMLGGGGGGGVGVGVGGGGVALGAGAGRPRGRPPLQPRAPAAPQDVVNLDSD